MIRHQFGQVEFASEHWFRLAATTLASTTRSAGLATPAKPLAARVRRIDLVGIGEHLASVILVLREGTIKQSLLTLRDPLDAATLNAAAQLLNVQLEDATGADIEARLDRFDGDDPVAELARRVAERLLSMMREFDQAKIEELFSDGLPQRHGGAGVRPEPEAPAGLHRARESGLPG